MAIKLTKKQAANLDKLSEAFERAKMALSEALDEIASDWESEIADKSDKWQESEAGQAAQERVDLVRGWFDEMPGEGEPAIDTESLL